MKTLIHFTAEWCGPCKRLKPVIDQFISDNTDIKYIQVDIDNKNNIELIKKYSVMSVPTLIAIADNQETKSHIGVATKNQLSDLFNK